MKINKEIIYAGVHTVVVGGAAMAISAGEVPLLGISKLAFTSIVGTIFGGTLAAYYAMGAYGQAHRMKEWKVQLLQAGIIGLGGLAATVALVALSTLPLTDALPMLGFFAFFAGTQALIASENRSSRPLAVYTQALPKSLFDYHRGTPIFAPVTVATKGDKFDSFFNEALQISMKWAKNHVLSTRMYNQEEISSLNNEGAQAVTNLGIFELLRKIELHKHKESILLALDEKIQVSGRGWHWFSTKEDDPYELKDILVELIELNKQLKPDTVEVLISKLILAKTDAKETQLKQSNPDQAAAMEKMFNEIIGLKTKILQLPKADARQPYRWQHALA